MSLIYTNGSPFPPLLSLSLPFLRKRILTQGMVPLEGIGVGRAVKLVELSEVILIRCLLSICIVSAPVPI